MKYTELPVECCTGLRIRKVSYSRTLEPESLSSSHQEQEKADHVSEFHVRYASSEQVKHGLIKIKVEGRKILKKRYVSTLFSQNLFS